MVYPEGRVKGGIFINRKNKLTIGEMAKLSGSTIRQIRYYERKGLLTPAFVDPFTGYRYYTLDQEYQIDIIRFCIEMDIPLSKFSKYLDENEKIDYSSFLAYGKKIAKDKISTLNKRLDRLNNMEQFLDLVKKYDNISEVYTRYITEKFFYCFPFTGSFEETDILDAFKSFLTFDIDYDNLGDFFEYGFLYEYSPQGVFRHIFVELTKNIPDENIKVIPSGTYICKQSDNRGKDNIERARDIFTDHLCGEDSFLAIETEIFNGNYKTGSADAELRVIPLHHCV